MISVEKFENTLQISRAKNCFMSFVPFESSRGVSSGNLEVFKTESELCIRPGSPERYKSVSGSQGFTPSTKLSVLKDTSSRNSFQDLLDLNNDQTPIKDMSLFLELDIEEVPEIGASFFSSDNEGKDLEIFEIDKEKSESYGSFASTSSKTKKVYEEFKRTIEESRKNYKNSCKIKCSGCQNFIVTDVKMNYPSISLFEQMLCSFCISAKKTVKCSYFCSNCKRFLTFKMDDLEFNLNSLA